MLGDNGNTALPNKGYVVSLKEVGMERIWKKEGWASAYSRPHSSRLLLKLLYITKNTLIRHKNHSQKYRTSYSIR